MDITFYKLSLVKSVLLLIGFLPGMVMADYYATGPYMAESCAGFISKKCKTVKLDAIMSDGQLLKIADFSHKCATLKKVGQ